MQMIQKPLTYYKSIPLPRCLFKAPFLPGCRYKTLANSFTFPSICGIVSSSIGGIRMEDIKSPSSITVRELSRLVKEFEEKILNGTMDPDRFLTLSEIEELWGKLIGDTNVLYSDMLQQLIRNVDERDLIRQKKENTRPKE